MVLGLYAQVSANRKEHQNARRRKPKRDAQAEIQNALEKVVRASD
jgi:hypothetical protein